MPEAESVTDDVGEGTMLPDPRVRPAIGAKGQTFVRHAVVATLLGVIIGMVVFLAAPRCNASLGSINIGCVAE